MILGWIGGSVLKSLGIDANIFKNGQFEGVIVFLRLLVIGVVWLDFSWKESLFASAVLSIIGVGGFWWKWEVW